MTRSSRRFAALARVALAVVMLLALTAGSAVAVAGATPRKAEKVRIALDWVANANYLGIYVALEKGYFAREGVDAQILPYANTPAETLIKAGKTDLGITYPPDVIINRAQGLRYKAVAALVSGNSTALAVLASSAYLRPAQLDGKLYGGFGIQSDRALVEAILHADGVAKPRFRQIVLNTAVTEALAKKRIDYSAVFGGIDDVTAELQGVKLRTFSYKRYLGAAGDYPNAVFAASDDTIASRGPALRAALKALAEGYTWAAQHPREAEGILVKWNRTALANAQPIVRATGDRTAGMFLDSSGRWGTMRTAAFSGLATILRKGGIVAAPPPASEVFTNALLPQR